MSNVRSRDTHPEKVVRHELFMRGYRFRLHGKNLPGKPDIVMAKHRAVILVHGCFWHHHKGCGKSKLPQSNEKFWKDKIMSNVLRDKRDIAALRGEGWRVLVLWECQIKKGSYIIRLSRFLKRVTVC